MTTGIDKLLFAEFNCCLLYLKKYGEFQIKGVFILRLSELYGYDIVGWAPAEMKIARKYMNILIPINNSIKPNFEITLAGNEICIHYYSEKTRHVFSLILENEDEFLEYKEQFEKLIRQFNFDRQDTELKASLDDFFKQLVQHKP